MRRLVLKLIFKYYAVLSDPFVHPADLHIAVKLELVFFIKMQLKSEFAPIELSINHIHRCLLTN